MSENINLASLAALAKKYFCRFPVYLNSTSSLEKFLSSYEPNTIAWVSKNTPTRYSSLTHLKAINVIGKEYAFIIFELDTHFDPNLFAALSGTLRGGGLFFIRDNREKHNDLFLSRIEKKILTSQYCINFEKDSDLKNIDIPASPTNEPRASSQEIAVQKITHVVKGHRNRPLVLLADRGRGKSAALGIAASQLLSTGLKEIILTAPSIDACHIVFKHLKLNLPEATIQRNHVKLKNSQLQFISPDNLIASLPKTNLLIIDEAAGIPSFQLVILLKHYSRIVFASTIHGYEGSGQCFSIKFLQQLDQLTPGWKKQLLTQPMRWNNNDPLETLTDELFLLKPLNEQTNRKKQINLSQAKIIQISQKTLVNNEDWLSQLYTLLSSAHYKTQPSDLRNIINEPNLRVFLTIANEIIIAAAFTLDEGKLAPDLEEAIYLGQRRPKGHLIPQILSLHLGIKNAINPHYLRIMRIAVLPEYQKKGLGSTLVKHLIQFAINKKYDAIGCLYSATSQLIQFWHRFDFSLVRLGHQKKSNTQGYAALMLKSLSHNAQSILKKSRQHFEESFPCQLRETHQKLDCVIVILILKQLSNHEQCPFPSGELKTLLAFSKSNRQFEDHLSLIFRYTRHALLHAKTFDVLNEEQLNILIIKILQQHSWKETSTLLSLPSKKAGIQLLKQTIIQLIQLNSQPKFTEMNDVKLE